MIRILSTSFFSFSWTVTFANHHTLPLSQLTSTRSAVIFDFYHHIYLFSFVSSLPLQLHNFHFDYKYPSTVLPSFIRCLFSFRLHLAQFQSDNPPQTNISSLVFPHSRSHRQTLILLPTLLLLRNHYHRCTFTPSFFDILHSFPITQDRRGFKPTLPLSPFQHHMYRCPPSSLPLLGSSLSTISVTPRQLRCLASSYTIIHILSKSSHISIAIRYGLPYLFDYWLIIRGGQIPSFVMYPTLFHPAITSPIALTHMPNVRAQVYYYVSDGITFTVAFVYMWPITSSLFLPQ